MAIKSKKTDKKDDKAAFLKEFGHLVSSAIYEKYGSKNKFLTETGIKKQSLHLVTTGGDTRLGTVYRIAKALDLKVKELMPDE
jgi:hypothetical protein